jgi:hypothetical protein
MRLRLRFLTQMNADSPRLKQMGRGWALAVAVLALGLGSRLSAAEDLVSPSRLERISRAYLGTPYKLDALGEASAPDKDPLFTRKRVDCQTLVEQVMSEAIAPAVGGQEKAVRAIRYRGGQVSLENRFHYCIPDWLKNPWPARDATAEVGGKSVAPVRRQIDLVGFLASRGGDPSLSPIRSVQSVTTVCIPRARVASLSPAALNGTIAVWVLNKPGIVAGHVGFLFDHGGKVVFRHASQKQHHVIDQPVGEYLARASKSVMGLIVLRPTMDGLKR